MGWPNAHADTQGIGRLNYAAFKERRHCTAFLTSEGHMVTAAHCLDVPSGAQLHYLDGYHREEWTRHIVVPAAAFTVDKARHLGIACSVTDGNQTRFKLSDNPLRAGDSAEAWGYGTPRKYILQQVPCRLKRIAAEHSYVLACPTSTGFSGGPLVSGKGEKKWIVGMVHSGNERITIATPLEKNVIGSYCREAPDP
jgi:V8-like Glu-specific endopeptidase